MKLEAKWEDDCCGKKDYDGQILRLVRIDFDNLENRNARIKKTVGVFVPKESLTAHGAASAWFDAQPPQRMYLGWDGQVYPQWQLEQDRAL